MYSVMLCGRAFFAVIILVHQQVARTSAFEVCGLSGRYACLFITSSVLYCSVVSRPSHPFLSDRLISQQQVAGHGLRINLPSDASENNKEPRTPKTGV